MKRNGKKKSILSDRNQVMGYISYVYLAPYVVCIFSSYIAWNLLARLHIFSLNKANAARTATGLCVWFICCEKFKANGYKQGTSTITVFQQSAVSPTKFAVNRKLWHLWWCQRYGTVAYVKKRSLLWPALQINGLPFFHHSCDNFTFSFNNFVSFGNVTGSHMSLSALNNIYLKSRVYFFM